MSLTYSDAIRNARLEAVESQTGASPKLRVYSGTVPANARASLGSATLLAAGDLPSDWMAAASSGSKAKAGTWSVTGQSAAGAGTAATFFRIYDAAGTTCHIQGTFGVSGTDMTIATNNIVDAIVYSVASFTLNAGN